MSQHDKARTEAARAAKICVICRKTPSRPGLMTCGPCVDKAVAYRRRQAGIRCSNCGHLLPEDRKGKSSCTSCLAAQSLAAARRQAKRKAEGKCARCPADATPGRTTCAECGREMLMRGRARRAELMRDRNRKVIEYACTVCRVVGHTRRNHDVYMQLKEAQDAATIDPDVSSKSVASVL